MEPKKWLADRGYRMEQGASGYWRLFYGEYLAVDAPGCDDVESDEDTAAAYFKDVAEDHEGPYKEGDVYDALAVYGAYPYCVTNDRDVHEWLWVLNEDGGSKVRVYTPENTAPEEWEDMCAKLRLSHAKRILGVDGGIICLNCDFDIKEQIIENLDFTEEEYEKVRTPNMVSFNEMVDNAIKSYDAFVADGWKHGDKVGDISYIINDMWSQII